MIRWIKRWWTYKRLKKIVLESTCCESLPWAAAAAEEVAERTRKFLAEHGGSLEATIENPDRIAPRLAKDDAVVPYTVFTRTDGRKVCVMD